MCAILAHCPSSPSNTGYYYTRPKAQGTLGVDVRWDAAAGGYRIVAMVKGDVWRATGGPLAKMGLDVRVGDVLLAINHQRLTPTTSPELLLAHAADQEVSITVSGRRQRAAAVVAKTEAAGETEEAERWSWLPAAAVDAPSADKAAGGSDVHVVPQQQDGGAGGAAAAAAAGRKSATGTAKLTAKGSKQAARERHKQALRSPYASSGLLPAAGEPEARAIRVRPIQPAALMAARYRDWVHANQQFVHSQSNKTIGA